MSHCSPARGCLLNITWTRFPPPHAALGAGPVLVMRSHAVRRSDNLQPDTRSEAPDDVRCHKTLVHRDHVRDTWQVWCCWASHMLRPTVFVTEGGHFVAGEWRHTRWPPAATTVRAQCRIKLQECGWQKLGRLAVKHPAENKMSRATKGCDV